MKGSTILLIGVGVAAFLLLRSRSKAVSGTAAPTVGAGLNPLDLIRTAPPTAGEPATGALDFLSGTGTFAIPGLTAVRDTLSTIDEDIGLGTAQVSGGSAVDQLRGLELA